MDSSGRDHLTKDLSHDLQTTRRLSSLTALPKAHALYALVVDNRTPSQHARLPTVSSLELRVMSYAMSYF